MNIAAYSFNIPLATNVYRKGTCGQISKMDILNGRWVKGALNTHILETKSRGFSKNFGWGIINHHWFR